MSLEGWFTSYGNYLVYQPLCLARQNLVLPPTRNVCGRQDIEVEVGSVAVAVDRPMKNIKRKRKKRKRDDWRGGIN